MPIAIAILFVVQSCHIFIYLPSATKIAELAGVTEEFSLDGFRYSALIWRKLRSEYIDIDREPVKQLSEWLNCRLT